MFKFTMITEIWGFFISRTRLSGYTADRSQSLHVSSLCSRSRQDEYSVQPSPEEGDAISIPRTTIQMPDPPREDHWNQRKKEKKREVLHVECNHIPFLHPGRISTKALRCGSPMMEADGIRGIETVVSRHLRSERKICIFIIGNKIFIEQAYPVEDFASVDARSCAGPKDLVRKGIPPVIGFAKPARDRSSRRERENRRHHRAGSGQRSPPFYTLHFHFPEKIRDG